MAIRYAGAGPIKNVLQGTLGGQTVFQAELQPHGKRIDLRVADTGGVLNDQVNDRFLAEYRPAQEQASPSARGRAGGWQSGAGEGTGPAPLANPSSESFDRLPLAVQTTLSAQAGAAPITQVTQGTLDGRTLYELTLTQQGRPVTVRVSEDGSLVSSTEAR